MSELPLNWSRVPLSEISAVPEQRVPRSSERFRYIDIASIDRERKVIRETQELTGESAPSRARKVVRTGDVLVSMTRPSLNAVALVPPELDGHIASTGFDVLRPKGVDSRWLYYLVRSQAFVDEMSDLVQGALYPAVRSKDVRAFMAPLAPLAEQKRIADKLDRLFATVDTCKARLNAIPAILKRFRQSVLAAATSGGLTEEWRVANATPKAWDRVPISELCEIQNGRAFPSVEYMDKGVRLLRPGNLAQSGAVEWNEGNTVCLPPSFAQEYPEFLLGADELLMNLTAQSLKDEFLGRVCLKIDATPALLNQRIARLLPKTEYDVRPWLFLFFKSPKFRAFVDSLDSGTLIRHMHSKQVRDYEVELPCVDEQREIWNRVDSLFTAVDALAAKLDIAKARIDGIPKSLLAKAFRGELVGQDSVQALAVELSACNQDSCADENIGVAAGRRKRA